MTAKNKNLNFPTERNQNKEQSVVIKAFMPRFPLDKKNFSFSFARDYSGINHRAQKKRYDLLPNSITFTMKYGDGYGRKILEKKKKEENKT
jgi:hypothetical protein